VVEVVVVVVPVVVVDDNDGSEWWWWARRRIHSSSGMGRRRDQYSSDYASVTGKFQDSFDRSAADYDDLGTCVCPWERRIIPADGAHYDDTFDTVVAEPSTHSTLLD
jgi:hypothetical protein